MASAAVGVAARSFALGIVQRSSANSQSTSQHEHHLAVPQHRAPNAVHDLCESRVSSRVTLKQAGLHEASTLNASKGFYGVRLGGANRFGNVNAFLPSLPKRRVRGSRGVTQCTAAGFGASGPSNESSSQEADHIKSTFGSKLRAVLFYLVTLIIAVPLFVVMAAIFPFQYLFDRYRRRALHVVNNVWANATTALFYKIDVIGAENLPPKDTPAVYVANHQSYLDIYSLFRLWVPFKFISKTSNFLLPIVGWSMFLTGHIPIKRMDARSQAKCLKACREMLSKGGPVLFFPEGTRSTDQKLASFKKGAFSIAAKAGVPIVPVTLVGTGKLMPSGKEGSLHSGGVKIVVHPPISGTDPDKLLKESREAIYKSLVEYGAE